MNPDNKKIKPTRTESVTDIVCYQWEVDQPFDVAVCQRETLDIHSLPPAVSIFRRGCRTIKTIAERSLNANLREESLC
jgi:hypothetical protein